MPTRGEALSATLLNTLLCRVGCTSARKPKASLDMSDYDHYEMCTPSQQIISLLSTTAQITSVPAKQKLISKSIFEFRNSLSYFAHV